MIKTDLETPFVPFASTVRALLVIYSGRDKTVHKRAQYWADYFGEKNWYDITVDDIEAGLAAYADRGKLRAVKSGTKKTGFTYSTVETGQPHSPATLNRMLMTMPTLVKLAKSRKKLVRSYECPTRHIPQLPTDNGRYVSVTREDVMRLIKAARLARWKLLPALIAFACGTGMRRGNIVKLKWGDIDLERGTATAKTSKNTRPFTAGIPEFALDELLKIKRAEHTKDTLVFGNFNFNRSFARAVIDAQLQEQITCFHCLRHVCASMMSDQGAQLQQVMAQLNQLTPGMAARYSHLNADALATVVTRTWEGFNANR